MLEYNDIKDLYHAKKHPAVIECRKTERQVLEEFLHTFEAHMDIITGEKGDNRISLPEWVEYYTNISASIDNDAYFA